MSEYKGLLPIIDSETVETVKKEFESEEGSLEKILSHMEHENSQMHYFLRNFSADTGYRKQLLCIGAFIYRCFDIKNSVPIVTPEAYHEVREEFETVQRFSRGMEKLSKTLEEDNPLICKYIKEFASRWKREDFVILITGLTIYQFFLKQAEFEALEKATIPFDIGNFPITHSLRKRLNIALFTENYEIASKIRDKINKSSEPLQ